MLSEIIVYCLLFEYYRQSGKPYSERGCVVSGDARLVNIDIKALIIAHRTVQDRL